MEEYIRKIEEIATRCTASQSDGYSQIMRICDAAIGEMNFILCYTNRDGKDVWEEIIGEDAMEVRVGEIAEEELFPGMNEDDIMVFNKSTQW